MLLPYFHTISICSLPYNYAYMYVRMCTLSHDYYMYTVSSLIIPSLDKELAEVNIPDISDDTDTWIGTMHYAFSK